MNSHLESLGRAKLQGILLLGVIFAIGIFTGVALERVRQSRPAPVPNAARGVAPPGWREQFHLTDEQERQIHEILERNRPRTEALIEQFLPRLRAATDSVRGEIRAILTPDQQREFDRVQPPLEPHPGDRRPPFGPPPTGFPPDGPRPGGPPPGGERSRGAMPPGQPR